MNGFAIPTHPVTGKSKRKPASPRGKNIVPKLKYAPLRNEMEADQIRAAMERKVKSEVWVL